MQLQVNLSAYEIGKLFENAEKHSSLLLKIVQKLTERIREFAVARTPIGEKYIAGVGWSKSGHMKSSWSPVVSEGKGNFSFYNMVPYANVVEEGLYPGISPRNNPPKTAYGPDGKIYSTQAIGGIVKPIIEGTAPRNMTAKYALDQAIAELEGMLK